MIYIMFLFIGGQRRTLSGYIGRFAKRVTENVDDAEVSLLKEYNKRDPEYVIWYGELKGVIQINGRVLIF